MAVYHEGTIAVSGPSRVRAETNVLPCRDAAIEVSVVVPCLNEDTTVAACVRRAAAALDELGVVGEVVVVDNGSTDRSRQVAVAAGARVIHEPLRGYGNALRRGFEEAVGRYVIMADCDESYDSSDLDRHLKRLRDGADLVMGNRLAGQTKSGAMS